MLSLAALFAAASSLASADSIQFIGVPTGVNDGHYYDLPYEISINGVDELVTCYDVFDDVNFGDKWQANLLSLSQASATGYFSADPGALAGYEEIAWLDAQSYQNTAEQIGLQYAIWNVFGTYATTADSRAYTAQANLAAASGYQGFNFSDVEFIEQIGGVVGRPGTEQAFVLTTPEASTLWLLLVGLTLVAAAHHLLHRRFQQSVVRVGLRRRQHLP